MIDYTETCPDCDGTGEHEGQFGTDCASCLGGGSLDKCIHCGFLLRATAFGPQLSQTCPSCNLHAYPLTITQGGPDTAPDELVSKYEQLEPCDFCSSTEVLLYWSSDRHMAECATEVCSASRTIY